MKSLLPKLSLPRSVLLRGALYFCAISLAAAQGNAPRPDPGAKDLYARLGVSMDAERGRIRDAYRTLAITFHPDNAADDPRNEEAMKRVSEAWEVLKNPGDRGSYTSDLKVDRLHPKYTASTTLPKFFAGIPRERVNGEAAATPKIIPPEVLAFREASTAERRALDALVTELKENLTGLHPQVEARSAKRYFRRVGEASETFLTAHQIKSPAIIQLAQNARHFGGIDNEVNALILAHVETLRLGFEVLFHYDLYLEDVLAWQEHLARVERDFVLAGFDLTKLGAREVRTLLESYYQKNYYAVQNLFESLRHPQNTEREALAVRTGLAALIEFPTPPPLRWIAGAHRFWVSIVEAKTSDRTAVASKVVAYLEEAHSRGELNAPDTDAILTPLLGQLADFAEASGDEALRTRLRELNAARAPLRAFPHGAESTTTTARIRAWGEKLRAPCVFLLNLARRRR